MLLFIWTYDIQYLFLNLIFEDQNIELKNSSSVIPCSSLNVSALRLITFDLFGALMLTEVSLQQSIGMLLPMLSSDDVANFTSQWLFAYQSYFGHAISPSITHHMFQWVLHSSLVNILSSFQLTKQVPEGSVTFNDLISSWSNLQPKVGAIEVLTKLSRKYQLGLLSNGDAVTLRRALRIFPSSVNVSLILSSDYPVNCFKPCSSMYAQALTAVHVHGDKTKVIHVAGSAFDTHGARTFGIYSGALDPSAIRTKPKPCFAFNDIKQLIAFFHV